MMRMAKWFHGSSITLPSPLTFPSSYFVRENMARRSENVYQIKLNVPKKVYEAYHSLNDEAKERLRKLIMMLILASGDIETVSNVIPITVSIDFTEETKEFIREVITGSKSMERLARKAGSFIIMLLRIKEELGCRDVCNYLDSNRKLLAEIIYLYHQLFGKDDENA